MKVLIYCLLLLGFVAPQLAMADSVLRVGSDVSINSDQTVEGNYYAATRVYEPMTMSGTVAGDMYAVGGTVTINGEVEEDLFILGGSSQVHATVTDDVRVVAGEVTIGEYVGGDLFVIGGTLTVLSSAQIDGTVFFFGGNGDISGTIAGPVVGYVEKLRIDGTVGGGIDVTVPAGLQLGSNADIAESVRYKSFVEIVRDPASVVGGEITKTKGSEITTKEAARTVLTPLFVVLFTALSIYLFFRRQLMATIGVSIMHPVRSSLIGTGVVLASPLVAAILLVTVLGALVGATIFLSAILFIIVGMVLAGSMLGSYLWYWYYQEVQVSLYTIIGGTTLLYALMMLPFVGILLYLLLTVQIIGAMGVRLYNRMQ